MYKRNSMIITIVCMLIASSSVTVRPTDSSTNVTTEVPAEDTGILSAANDAYLDASEKVEETVDNGRSFLQELWGSFVIKCEKGIIRTVLFALDMQEAFRNKYLAFKHVIRNMTSNTKK